MSTINTRLGPIKGIERNGTTEFLGIPYAAPPVGALRWRPPEPAKPWSGTYDATTYANRSFQPPLPESIDRPEANRGELSEDCLYLNVRTPKADGKKRPVLFYIHGGGYYVGSANDLDLTPFAQKYDVVVVETNYRLGLLGFLDLSRFGPEFTGSVSLGFQDQIAALKWVRENIEDYGGDPDSITLSGVSAGAGAVLALLAAPSASGLFHRAMAISPLEVSREPIDAIAAISAHLNMDEAAVFEHLKSLTGQEVLDLQVASNLFNFASVDGTVIQLPTSEAIKSGINRVPIVTGACINEGTMITPELPEDPAIVKGFEMSFAPNIGDGDADRYGEYLDRVTEGMPLRERMNRVYFDYFRSYALRCAQAATDVGSNAWVYSFEVPTDHEYGPTHGSDVPFVYSLLEPVDPSQQPLEAYHENNDTNRKIAAIWSQTFGEFARNGDPNWSGLPEWPVYDAKTRACLVLQDTPRVVNDPDGDEVLSVYGLK